MKSNTIGSFFARLRWKWFKRRINFEIHDRMAPHLQHEADHGYPFHTEEEMGAQTEELNIQPVLNAIEEHIRNMPKAYSKSFRHVLHRELHPHLCMFERLAKRGVNRSCDPRHIATRA